MLKGIDFDVVSVDLGANEQFSPEHLARNPLGRVPALFWEGRCLAESVAIIEFLEETVPSPALYPADRWARARARQVVEVVNSGIQPMQSPAVANRARETAEERTAWSRFFNERGLAAVERLLELIAGEQAGSGRFCVGDRLTVADICLVTQVWSARRFGADLSAIPRGLAVEAAALATEHAARAHPDNQLGAPAKS